MRIVISVPATVYSAKKSSQPASFSRFWPKPVVFDTAPLPAPPNRSQKARLSLLAALVVLTVAVRGVGIMRPLVGHFATKNVVYAMIARNWAEGRTSVWYPMLDCMVGGVRSLHMLEWPASAYATGLAWKIFGGSLDIWGRAISVVMTAAAVATLFLFVGRRHGTSAAAGAGLGLALSPVAIIYGQSFMLEASLAFFAVATFYCVDRWMAGGRWIWLPAAAACFGLLTLTKVYMVVLLLPLAAWVVRPPPMDAAKPMDTPTWPRLLAAGVAAAAALIPACLWYWHALRTAAPDSPLADHVFYSVRHSATAHRPPHPLLWSADFYRQILDDLTGVVLTPIGFAVALAGFLDRRWRWYAPWLFAMVLLLVALPRKFYEMNYYWMGALPVLCILAGLGWQFLGDRLRPGRAAVSCLLLVTILLALRYAAGPAWRTPEEDLGVVAGGAAVERLTKPEEPVLTMHGTTIDLLYYSNRPGWAVPPEAPLDQAIKEAIVAGARYLVVVCADPAELPDLVQEAEPFTQGGGYRVYALETLAAR